MEKGLALKEYSTSLGIILRIADFISILITGAVCFELQFSTLNLDITHKNLLLLGVLFGTVNLAYFGAYRAWRGATFASEIKCISSATLATFFLLIVSSFITQSSDSLSRSWVISWLSTSTAFILTYRLILKALLGTLRKKGFNVRNVIIIGEGELAQKIVKRLNQHPEMGLIVKGFVSTIDQKINTKFDNSTPLLGSLIDLDQIVNTQKIDQVWVALPISDVHKMPKVQLALSNSSIVIRMVPDIFGFQLLNQSMTEVAGLPVINISTSHMLEGKNRVLKLLEDKILSLLILILISPIALVLAITIKLTSKGPILFKQYRTGANGQSFKVYKFRSMVVHDEEGGKVTQAKQGDSRITPIGAFMRKTSLDELPQFINVLQGRMSIVGPRPHALAHNDHYKSLVESYMQRHMVRPGITGWAQINGFRGETDTIDKMKSRIEYDLHYIENWSLWFDLKIIFLTIFKGFINKN